MCIVKQRKKTEDNRTTESLRRIQRLYHITDG